MIQLSSLSTETRKSIRPPLISPHPSPELLLRLVPLKQRYRKSTPAFRREQAVNQGQWRGKRSPVATPRLLHLPVYTDQPVEKKNGSASAYRAAPEPNKPVINQAELLKQPQENPPAFQEREPATQNPQEKAPAVQQREPAPQIPRENPPAVKVAEPAQQTRQVDQLPVALPTPDRPEAEPVNQPSNLRKLLEDNPGLPAQSIVLGVCADGLPLALDLHDPTPGSLLAVGDERVSQMELLRTAVKSAALRNSPRAFQFLVFSHQPNTWREWVSTNQFDRHCLDVVEAQEEAVCDWIIRLADWTEQRRMGQRSGPAILFIADSLRFLPRLAYDIRLNLDWMIKEGPQAQIWTLAAMSTELVGSLGSRFLRPFQTRIYGRAKTADDYFRLGLLNEQQVEELSQPGAFTVQVGEQWIKYWLAR